MCELQRAESAASERRFAASSASSEQCVERNRADEAFQGVEIGDHGGVRARRGRFGGAAVEWEECGSGGGERRASSDRGVVCGEGRKGSGEWGVQTGEEGAGDRVRGGEAWAALPETKEGMAEEVMRWLRRSGFEDVCVEGSKFVIPSKRICVYQDGNRLVIESESKPDESVHTAIRSSLCTIWNVCSKQISLIHSFNDSMIYSLTHSFTHP